MPSFWTWALVRLAAMLAAGTIVGALYGQAILGALIAALIALAWHGVQLYRLERWLSTGRRPEIPDAPGVWPVVLAKIDFLKARAKRRRKKFRRLIKELRASTEAFPDGGIVLNAEHEILAYNQAAQELVGLRRKSDRRQRVENLLRHPDFIAYLEDPGEGKTVEIPSPLGGERWLSCRLIPYGPDQKLLLLRDITQGVKLARMRRDFVANASHELRSPLTVITGYLDGLAADSELPAQWQQPVATMHAQAVRMRRLIEDLLQLSMLESGRVVARDRVIDMGAMLAAARKEALAAPEHPQSVELEMASDAGLLGEETEIQSVVSNLVSNAVRYTPVEGRVVIRWSVDEEGGHLAVEDTGIGIAEDELERVTERFYRTDRGRARQQGGTGLGLAIVKHALRRHDARLEIRSRLGHGSTFVCHFPRSRVAVSC